MAKPTVTDTAGTPNNATNPDTTETAQASSPYAPPPGGKRMSIDDVDDTGYVEEVVGFYPYWAPFIVCPDCKTPDGKQGRKLGEREYRCQYHPTAVLKGARFKGIPLIHEPAKNEDDFGRFTLQATVDMPCQRGKKSVGEHVIVPAGEFFNVSEYAGLPLESFYGAEVLVTALSKSEMNDGKTLWKFQVKVDAKTKALLDSKRAELSKAAQAAYTARRVATVSQGVQPKQVAPVKDQLPSEPEAARATNPF